MKGLSNNSGQSYANTLVPHRIVAYGTYRKEYLKNFATTIGFTYIGNSGNNFSYTYANDLNSDGTNGNDLIYIPRSQSEILLTTTNANDNRSIDQIWQQLDNYIQQDDYLSKNRGKYAERNGACRRCYEVDFPREKPAASAVPFTLAYTKCGTMVIRWIA